MTSSVVLVEEQITFVSKIFSKINFYVGLHTDSVPYNIDLPVVDMINTEGAEELCTMHQTVRNCMYYTAKVTV